MTNKEKKRVRAKKYYENNKQAILKRNEIWRQNNLDKVKAKKKERYLENREDEIKRTYSYRTKKRCLINKIAIHYGCQNLKCGWSGDFLPCHLDFHHLDPSTKEGNISVLASSTKQAISTEINKCVVLCRNCHQQYHAKKYELAESMLCRVTDDLQIITP